MATIESVIFDWGGVLIDNPTPALMTYCAGVLGVLEQDYIEVHGKFEPDFNKGLIDEKVFWEKVCGELGVSEPECDSLWIEAFGSVYSPRPEVFSLAGLLHRGGYKVGLLSNTERPAMQYFYRQGYDMFDAIVFSCAEGVEKPERIIYELMLERLGSEPERSVLIDDKRRFIEGARAVGLNTILFESAEQVKKRLRRLYVKID